MIRWDSPLRLARSLWHMLEFWVQGRPVLATKRVVAHRLAVCEPCRFNDHGQCRKCTCYLHLKVRLSGEECPDTPPRWKRLTLSRKLTPDK